MCERDRVELKENGSRKIMARLARCVPETDWKLPCYLFQCATATSTRESADSTWSCTSCRAVSAEAFVCSAGILRQEGTVITAAKVTTGTRRDRSRIARPANVSAPAARQLHVNPTKTPQRDAGQLRLRRITPRDYPVARLITEVPWRTCSRRTRAPARD